MNRLTRRQHSAFAGRGGDVGRRRLLRRHGGEARGWQPWRGPAGGAAEPRNQLCRATRLWLTCVGTRCRTARCWPGAWLRAWPAEWALTAFYIALSRGAMGASAAVSGLLAAAIPALLTLLAARTARHRSAARLRRCGHRDLADRRHSGGSDNWRRHTPDHGPGDAGRRGLRLLLCGVEDGQPGGRTLPDGVGQNRQP